MRKQKAESRKPAKKVMKVYRFEFPKDGADWYAKKSGSVRASSRAEAKRELVKRGVLDPIEARVAELSPVQAQATHGRP